MSLQEHLKKFESEDLVLGIIEHAIMWGKDAPNVAFIKQEILRRLEIRTARYAALEAALAIAAELLEDGSISCNCTRDRHEPDCKKMALDFEGLQQLQYTPYDFNHV